MFLGLIRTVFKAPSYRRCAANSKGSSIRLNTAAALHTAPRAPGKRLPCTTWKNTTTLGSYIAYRGISSSKARAPNIHAGPFLKQPPGSQARHCSSGGRGGAAGSGFEGGSGGGGEGSTTTRCSPELEALFHGNQQFRASIAATSPGLLKVLASEGQRPPFMLLDCSDSRVGEHSIFSAKPGTMFTTGNIANQYNENDLNSKSVLSYAVEVLGVKHVIVMGHYGCGGVAAAITRPPTDPIDIDSAVQSWIRPIRAIYQNSARPEIVAHREKHGLRGVSDVPHLHDPAFRALVEENVKANVVRVARSPVITGHYAALASPAPRPNPSPSPSPGALTPTLRDVFIHGWVYDIETGEVADLGVSVGPPGREIPATPFPRLVHAHAHAQVG